MGNANCKKKSERKRQIMISKSKLFLESLKSKENQPVFIDQPNMVNSHFQQQFREQFAKEATPICMLATIDEFDALISADSLEFKIEAVMPWVNPNMVLVFKSEESRSRKTVLSASKQREEKEETYNTKLIRFDDPRILDQIKEVAE